MASGLGWGAGIAGVLALALWLGGAGLASVPFTAVAFGFCLAAVRSRRSAAPAPRSEPDDVSETAVSATVVDEALRRFDVAPAASQPRPPRPTSDPSQPFDLYVSYVRADNEAPTAEPFWVEAFLRRLNEARRRVGLVGDYNVFFDTEPVRTVSDWEARLAGSLHQSTGLLVLMSPRWLASEVCHHEWQSFVDRGSPAGRPCVLPVLLETLEITARSSPREIRAWFDALPEHVVKPVGDPRSVATDVHERVDSVTQHDICDLALAWDSPWPELMSSRAIDPPLDALARRIDAALDAARPLLAAPYDPFFVGRDAELTLLRSAFPSRAALVTPAAGQRGLGRSALIAHHALQRAADYVGGVHWVDCAGVSSLSDALRPIDPSLGPKASVSDVLDVLRERSGPRGACLIVFYGVGSPELLTDMTLAPLLDASWVHVAAVVDGVTGHGQRRTVVEVPPISIDDGVELIRRRLPGRAFQHDEDRQAARGIVSVLGGHTRTVQAISIEIGSVPPHRCADLLDRLRQDATLCDTLLTRHASKLPTSPANLSAMVREGGADQP